MREYGWQEIADTLSPSWKPIGEWQLFPSFRLGFPLNFDLTAKHAVVRIDRISIYEDFHENSVTRPTVSAKLGPSDCVKRCFNQLAINANFHVFSGRCRSESDGLNSYGVGPSEFHTENIAFQCRC
jgi:hypothetical protein